jgi:hypothetical protein
LWSFIFTLCKNYLPAFFYMAKSEFPLYAAWPCFGPEFLPRPHQGLACHTSVILLKEAGIPDPAIMALVGHDSVAMSQHYTHVGREALEKAANALPDIEALDAWGPSPVGSAFFVLQKIADSWRILSPLRFATFKFFRTRNSNVRLSDCGSTAPRSMPVGHAEKRNMVFHERRGSAAQYRHEKFKTSHNDASRVRIAINNSGGRVRTRWCIEPRRRMAATRAGNAFRTRSSKVALELRAGAVGANRERSRLRGRAMITMAIFWALVLALFATNLERPNERK